MIGTVAIHMPRPLRYKTQQLIRCRAHCMDRCVLSAAAICQPRYCIAVSWSKLFSSVRQMKPRMAASSFVARL